MNIIYETTKERGATILIPTSMVDSMNPVVALALAGQETAPQRANGLLSFDISDDRFAREISTRPSMRRSASYLVDKVVESYRSLAAP